MLKKASFLNADRPFLMAMVQASTPVEAECIIADALYDGADSFGIQLCNLLPEYRNEETLRRIFNACMGRPIYITSYRLAESKKLGLDDDGCMDLLLMGLRAGATLCDVMGDLYHPEPQELTFDPVAVEKQKALIDKIHEMGGEVLISSHVHTYFDEDRIMEYAFEQARRGADVVKIVSIADDEEQMMVGLNAIHRLKRELDRPFLFLTNGRAGRLIRQFGPALGVCMYLCIEHFHPVNSKQQIPLRVAKQLRDCMLL
jgi:hypothetical protein